VELKGIAVQPDGKILLFGHVQPSTSFPPTKIVLIRLKSDGAVDEAFGNEGRIEMVLQHVGNRAFSIGLTGNQKIVLVAGKAVLRVNLDGSLDSTFGTNGIKDTGLHFSESNMAFQSDGKYLFGGEGFGLFRLWP